MAEINIDEEEEEKGEGEYSGKTKWVAFDAWRGMEQPVLAVFGCSDTGMWEDSPCPSKKINDSIDKVEKILEDNGIKSEKVWTRSSNLFMIKRWLVVDKEDFKKAKETVKNIELSDCCHLW